MGSEAPIVSDVILVVDDDNAIREILEVNLVAEGFEVCSAGGGAEALELARRRRPALVLLDLMMPGMNGLEVCKGLRADHHSANSVIIVLTASADREHLLAALSRGADDYVTNRSISTRSSCASKPVSADPPTSGRRLP